MKILNPILDIIKYLKMYQLYLGYRMYLIYFLGLISSFLEGIGIIMLLPLLQSIDNGNRPDEFDGKINEYLYQIIEFLGFSNSMASILLLISFAFVFKGIIAFFSHGLTAYLMGELLKEIKIKLFNLYSKMN